MEEPGQLEFKAQFGGERLKIELAQPGDALYGVAVDEVTVFFSSGDVLTWRSLEELRAIEERGEPFGVPCERNTEMLLAPEQVAKIIDFAHSELAQQPIGSPGPLSRPSALA